LFMLLLHFVFGCWVILRPMNLHNDF
jgi:hypothetical protein